MWRTPPWMIVTRDLVCLVLGSGLMLYEVLLGKGDLARMAFYLVMIVAPGLWASAWLGRSDTGQQSLPPASDSSSASSSSSGP